MRDHPFLWVKHLNSLEFQTPKRPYLVPTLVAEVNVLFWYFFRISRDAQCCISASTNSSFFAAQKRLTMFSAGCNENSPQQISGLSCSDCKAVSTAKQSRLLRWSIFESFHLWLTYSWTTPPLIGQKNQEFMNLRLTGLTWKQVLDTGFWSESWGGISNIMTQQGGTSGRNQHELRDVLWFQNPRSQKIAFLYKTSGPMGMFARLLFVVSPIWRTGAAFFPRPHGEATVLGMRPALGSPNLNHLGKSSHFWRVGWILNPQVVYVTPAVAGPY